MTTKISSMPSKWDRIPENCFTMRSAIIGVFILCVVFLVRVYQFVDFADWRNLYMVQGRDSDTLGHKSKWLETDGSLPLWKQQLFRQASLPPVLGKPVNSTKFLTIGISSVYRVENYLEKTLNSIILETDPEDKENCVVVIFLGDIDEEDKQKQMHLIESKFSESLDSGFIQVITATQDIYPTMSFALKKRTYGDSVDRIIWRSKQVIDFAFLFSYVKSQSEYYFLLEDDVIVSPHFVNAIQDFIELKQKQLWVALHFSDFYAIALLFRTKDLPDLSRFLLMFYQDMPVDGLIRNFIGTASGDALLMRRVPSIVQHIGKQSTLPNKVQNLVDGSFNTAAKRFNNRNPKIVAISSSMATVKDFVPKNAYSPAPGYFCGQPVGPQQTFQIAFQIPTVISRLVIISGLPGSRDKIIHNATVLASSNSAAPQVCMDYKLVANFTSDNGELDQSFNPKLESIQCLQMIIQTSLNHEVIIREIQVFQS